MATRIRMQVHDKTKCWKEKNYFKHMGYRGSVFNWYRVVCCSQIGLKFHS